MWCQRESNSVPLDLEANALAVTPPGNLLDESHIVIISTAHREVNGKWPQANDMNKNNIELRRITYIIKNQFLSELCYLDADNNPAVNKQTQTECDKITPSSVSAAAWPLILGVVFKVFDSYRNYVPLAQRSMHVLKKNHRFYSSGFV